MATDPPGNERVEVLGRMMAEVTCHMSLLRHSAVFIMATDPPGNEGVETEGVLFD